MTGVPFRRRVRLTIAAVVSAAAAASASPALAAPSPNANVAPDSPAYAPHGPHDGVSLKGTTTVEVL